jgi:tol-pal system protein YbgF
MTKHQLLVSVLVSSLALAPMSANAQLFGPTDEEKARESGQDQGIKDLQNTSQQQDTRTKGLEDKVQALTDSLSQLTGTNEELNHQIQQQNEKIDRMQKDFAYRLCQLSAQQLGAGDSMNCAASGTPSANGAVPGGMTPGQALPPIGTAGAAVSSGAANGAAASLASVPPPADNGAAGRGRAPGVLGTLPADSAPASAGSSASAVPPAGSSKTQYDQAMNLMRRAQYEEAAAAFRTYADSNPADSDLSPQAIYWVANISFIRQDYAGAARTFAEVIKKFPKSRPASEAMLKLAQSFMAMGQKSEGCTTLGLIKSKYPEASPQTLSQAATLRKTACIK